MLNTAQFLPSLLPFLLLASPQLAFAGTGDGGFKLLNNLISVAQSNLQVSGEFLTNYYPVWVANTDRVQAQPNCARQAIVPDPLPPAVKNIYNSGVLRIGVTSVVNLPYYNTSGTPGGFFYDLGNSVANELGFMLGKTITAQFTVIPTTSFFNDITAALNNYTVDTVIGVSYLKARTQRVDFSCWYEGPSPFAVWRDNNAALPPNFTLPSSYLGWNTPAIKVATLKNTIYETAVATYLPLATRVYFPTMNEAYASVGTGGATGTDIVFSIIGETESWNIENHEKLSIQPGTRINYGGGNAFATAKVFKFLGGI